MNRLFAIFVLFLGLGMAAPAGAQSIERDPGYIDLADLEQWYQGEPKIEVNLKGSLLRMVAEASRQSDPDLASLLGKLKAIYVRAYDLKQSEYTSISKHAADFARRLEGRGWETVARVREDDERVDMFVRTNGDAIAGLVVIVVSPEDDESVFLNIVGDIDPAEIGRIGSKFNIDALDDEAFSRGRGN